MFLLRPVKLRLCIKHGTPSTLRGVAEAHSTELERSYRKRLPPVVKRAGRMEHISWKVVAGVYCCSVRDGSLVFAHWPLIYSNRSDLIIMSQLVVLAGVLQSSVGRVS